jgi:hypothetical protein
MIRMSLSCPLLVVVALLAPGPLSAQNPAVAKVSGVVKKVDVKAGTIVIRPKAAMEDETFSLLKRDIGVTAPGGQKGEVADLAPGQTVQLLLGLSGDVEAVLIQSQVFVGTVSDVNVARRSVTIARGDGRFMTMAVDAAAKITLAKRPAYLREIKPGSEMNVSPSLDGKKALELTLIADPDGKLAAKLYPRIKTSRLPGTRWVGAITSVDPTRGELQLTGPKTKGSPRTMVLAPDALIQQMHSNVALQPLTLRQIVGRPQATLLVSSQNQVTRVLVATVPVPATVLALDAERGSITVNVDGQRKTFALPTDVKVMDKGRVRRLTDLRVDMPVQLVLSLGEQRLLALDIHGGA